MNPWVYDAGNIDIGRYFAEDARRDDDDKYLVTPYGNTEIREFVRASNIGSSKQVVVAPKGYGKTLLLRYRAQWMRDVNADTGVVFFPSGKQDIEYLKVELEASDLYKLITPIPDADTWSKVWECALLATGCQAVGAQTLQSRELDGIFPYKPSTLRVSAHLETILRLKDDRPSLLSSDLSRLRNVFSEIGKDVVIIIDNADEMFKIDRGIARSKSSSDKQHNDAEYSYDFSQDVPKAWNNLQAGLLLAIRSIARQAKGLHVYTSLRAEALSQITEQTLLQARDHCVDLKYSDQSLRRIFCANIEMYDDDQMNDPTAEDPIQRWLGIKHISHPYVKTPGGVPESEEVFEFILRHSLYSPRDLMVLGEAIAAMKSLETHQDSEHISAALRECVNETARDTIFDQWKETAIPRWSDHYFQVMGLISSNVISADELQLLDETTYEQGRHHIPFTEYMFQHGLLGYSHERPSSPCQQLFLTSWKQRLNGSKKKRKNFEGKVVPSADLYFIHPLLNDVIRHHVSNGLKFAPDEKNIVGYGRIYNTTEPTILLAPSPGHWPVLKHNGKTVYDGCRALGIYQLALITLMYTSYETQKNTVSIAEVIDVYERMESRFGTPKKRWLDSLSKDSGHINTKIAKMLDDNASSKFISCIGKNSKTNLPEYFELRICEARDIYVDPEVMLSDPVEA